MKKVLLVIILSALSFSIYADVKTVMLPAQSVTIDQGGSGTFDDSFTYNIIISKLSASISGDDADYVSVVLNEWNQNTFTGYTTTNITLSISEDAPIRDLSVKLSYWIDFPGGWGMSYGNWTITVNQTLSIKADFEAEKITGIAPFDVTFSNLSSGEINDFLWYFGDGDSSTLESPTHTYTEPGIYNVTLKISNNEEATKKTKNEYIEVLDPLAVRVNFSDSISSENYLSIFFTDESLGNITSWLWDFGDGETSSDQNPNHIYSNIGTYEVKLIASNIENIDSIIRTIDVGFWKYKAGSYVRSSPAIGTDGTIYVGCDDEYLYAINADGTYKWKYKATSDFSSASPAIGTDGTIYIGNYDDHLYAVNADGTLKWKYDTGNNIYSSPAIGNDGTIYIGTDKNYIYAIKPDGSLKWNYGGAWFGTSFYSPIVGKDGSIYVGSGDNNLYAINGDGTMKWKFEAGDNMYSSPAIDKEGTIYIGSKDKNLYAINADGTLKWKFETGDYVGSSPAIGSDGTIYFGSSDKYFYAINNDGTLKWKFHTGYYGPIYSSPAIGNDGTIYVGSHDSYFYAINADGSLKWKYETGRSVRTSPVIGEDGTVYFGSDDKHLYAFKTENGGLAETNWPCFRGMANRAGNLNYGNPDAPIAGFSATPISGDSPLNVQFTNTSKGAITSWLWNFGDGETSTEQNPNHQYKMEGTFMVSLMVTGELGSDTETKKDFINTEPAPIADFSSNITTGDKELSVSFTDKTTGDASSWSWNFGDSGTSTEQNPVHTYTIEGTYTVSLSVTGAGGSDNETKTDYITVNVPTEIIEISKNKTINIYPNPTTGLIDIEGLPQNEVVLINIYDVLGQKMKEIKIQEQNANIDLSSFKKGIYYLKFNSNNNSSVKIIKE